MKARTSLWASVAIAASVGLAGCGGSNDNDETIVVDEPSGPTAEEQLAAANKRADDAEGREAAAKQAAARKEARELAEALAKGLATIGNPAGSDAIPAVTGAEQRTRSAIPVLKAAADDPTMFSGTSGGDTFTAHVHSTKADTEKTFGLGALPDGIDTDPDDATEGPLGTYDAAAGVVTFESTGVSKDIKADDLPKNVGNKDYGAGERAFDGTLAGAAGTYKCEGETCTAVLSADGVTLSVGTWTFTPDDAATIKVADSDGYLSFGWWLQKNSGGGIEDAGPVSFWSNAGDSTNNIAVASALPDTLSGDAVYKREDGAAGKYAMHDADGDSSEAGHFTADAELTVDFTAGAGSDTVSGKIYNFATESGDKDWMVTLGESNAFADSSGTWAFRNGDTTWSIGDDKSVERGGYTAGLYDGGSSPYSSSSNTAPDEIGGTFSAEHGKHYMIGAFAGTLATTDDGAAE